MTAINLEERKRFIGASESAALLGISNYARLYKGKEELFKQKTNQTGPEQMTQNNLPSIFWGHQLEEAVITAVPLLYPDYTWTAGKLECHWLDGEVEGMACSPDSLVWHEEDGLGVLEAKTTKNPRIMPVDGSCPPAWYCQVQHQLACSEAAYPDEGGLEYGVLHALVQGHDSRLWRLEKNQEMIDTIRSEIKLFWEEVAEWRAKQPDPQPECTAHEPETDSSVSNEKEKDDG